MFFIFTLLFRGQFKQTKGFFNPLVDIAIIGYNKSFEKIEKNSTSLLFNKIKKQNLNLNKIKINGNKIFIKNNQNIDFGGIIKGYTVDIVKKYLEKIGYNDFLINAGGDMYIKSTTGALNNNNVNKKEITIAIEDPFINGNIFALIDLKNKSLCTSGIYKRKWQIKNKNFHHILTPDNNINNNEIASISLITDKCYLGDSYATASVAMGIKKAILFLKRQKIDAIIIGNNKNIYKIGNLEKYNLEIIKK